MLFLVIKFNFLIIFKINIIELCKDIYIFIEFNKIWLNKINNFRIHIIENNKYINYFGYV